MFPPAPVPVLMPPVTGGWGSFVFSGSFLTSSFTLRVARASSRKSGSALGVWMLAFDPARNAADPVGARVRRRSDRPSEGRTEREEGMSAPLLDKVWSNST